MRVLIPLVVVAALLDLCVPYSPAWSQEASSGPATTPREIPLDHVLVIEPVGRFRRSAMHTDAIEARIVSGSWTSPRAGDTVNLPDGSERRWEAVQAGEDGWIRHAALQGGYACAEIESAAERVVCLEALGHSMVYVNDEPRAGDPYSTGWVLLPVRLRPGMNTFLFAVGRGQLRAKLLEPKADVLFNPRDPTLPDVLRGVEQPLWGALPVLNATARWQRGLAIEAACGDARPTRTDVPAIPPLSVRKVGFQLAPPRGESAGEVELTLRLLAAGDGGEKLLDTAEFKLATPARSERHKRTFISDIDGSVQYYAVTPAQPADGESEPPALFLTLHGASVEAAGLTGAYAPKSWGHIVAPTNRRPFGFDWEDWGRLDALEVLQRATTTLGADARRTYLTGHSMGGHGVWHFGVTFPDRFAAIAPSAGWITFWSYVGAERPEGEAPIEQLLRRASNASDTLAISRNYLHYGIYILHGERDDDVPVEQARLMRKHLAEFHPDFVYREQPGAVHWWGNECVDWPPLFDFFRYHRRPETASVRHVEFHTVNPAVSASSHWVTIEAQMRPLEPSSVVIDLDPAARSFTGTTSNVARLGIDLTALSRAPAPTGDVPATQAVLPAEQPITVQLDEQALGSIPWPGGELRVWLAKDAGNWTFCDRPAPQLKGPQRYGPFKEVFRNRVMFVYGTGGTPQENAANFNKARYDAETFWYRGNGSIDVLPDTEFASGATPERNVVLYGNADTNGVWPILFGECPVQVRRGRVSVGQRDLTGDDLAVLAVYPLSGSERAVVGVVGGSGVAGMRLTERIPYFVSGVAFPDWIVLGPETLQDGLRGVRGTGFFGSDWRLDPEQSGWREP